MATTAQIIIIQEQKKTTLTLFSQTWSIRGNVKIDLDKLCENTTKRVFRLVGAENNGLGMGIQLTKPFRLMVKINNKLEFDTASVCTSTALAGLIKIKINQFRKDIEGNTNTEFKRFEGVLKFIINEGQIASKQMRKCFVTVPEKKPTDAAKSEPKNNDASNDTTQTNAANTASTDTDKTEKPDAANTETDSAEK